MGIDISTISITTTSGEQDGEDNGEDFRSRFLEEYKGITKIGSKQYKVCIDPKNAYKVSPPGHNLGDQYIDFTLDSKFMDDTTLNYQKKRSTRK